MFSKYINPKRKHKVAVMWLKKMFFLFSRHYDQEKQWLVARKIIYNFEATETITVHLGLKVF